MGCKLHTRERPDSDTLFTHQGLYYKDNLYCLLYTSAISHYNLEEFDEALKIFERLMKIES